jgi:VanZ like family/Concanavalin A-like lectin/glucanases superfamily
MIPTGLRHPSLSYILDIFNSTDFVNNLILYMPLGIALGGTSLIRAFLFGLCLSTCAEALQLGYVDRIPSFLDILSNTCGAVIGYLIARMLLQTGHDPRLLRLYRPVTVAAIPIAILGTLALLHHSPASDFSDWSPAFHLAVGNELTGDRPWSGTISELAIYPFAMSPAQISDIARQATGSSEAAIVGPMQLTASTTRFGRPLLSKQAELTLYNKLVSRSQLTLVVRMQTNNLEQSGPARIVTYSLNPVSRNFTLGQIGNMLTFRLRTPGSGLNGSDPALYSGPVLSLGHSYLVAAVYDGRISRLYVDGKLVGEADLGAQRPRLPRRGAHWLPGPLPIREIELGGAEILLSGLFAIGIFALCGVPGRPLSRFLLGAVAGGAIGAIVWVFGVSSPGLGTRILLECTAAGLLISASVEGETAVPRTPAQGVLQTR